MHKSDEPYSRHKCETLSQRAPVGIISTLGTLTSVAVSAAEHHQAPISERIRGWNELRLTLSMHSSVALAASRVFRTCQQQPTGNGHRWFTSRQVASTKLSGAHPGAWA